MSEKASDRTPVRPTIASPARSEQWAFRLLAFVTIIPILTAAVRNGLRHWLPTWDAAILAVRVNDVFSSHMPLTGMAASPGGGNQPFYSQPGSVEALLLAIPVKIFGLSWGLLIGISLINSAAVVTFLWLTRRRCGFGFAVVAAVATVTLLWSLGSEVLVDVNPGQVGIIPFLAFLAAGWSVIDGDDKAVVVMAAVGNFLLLTHLRFAFVVPVVVLVTIAIRVAMLIRTRRMGPAVRVPHERQSTRWWLIAAGLSIVLWLPTIWDQFAGSGNLMKLVRTATGAGTGSAHGSIAGGLGALASVTAVPPWWLPPSFQLPPFDSAGDGKSVVLRLVFGVMLLAGFTVLSLSAYRRRDRTVLAGLATAVVAWVAMLTSWVLNPSAQKLAFKYFWEVWPLSAFLWVVLAIATVRAVPVRARPSRARLRRLAVGGCALLVLGTVAALPRRNNCGGRCSSMRDEMIPASRAIRSTIAHADLGPGPVLVTATSGWPGILVAPSIFGLQDRGIPFRVPDAADTQQYGASRSEANRHDAKVKVLITDSPETPKGGHRLGEFATPPFLNPQRYQDLRMVMQRWISRTSRPMDDLVARLSTRSRDLVYQLGIGVLREQEREAPALEPLARFVTDMDRLGLVPTHDAFGISGMTDGDVRLWALETVRRESGTIYAYRVPI